MVDFHSNIDWLTLTGHPIRISPLKGQVQLIEAAELAVRLVEEFSSQKALLIKAPKRVHYAYGFACKNTGIVVHVSLEWHKQGVMVVWDGEACKNVSSWAHVIAAASERKFAATRIDVAFNTMGSGHTTRSLIDRYAKLAKKEGKRRWEAIYSANGDTLYIGSRESEKMLRIYDKGKQQNLPIDWLRIELEIKGSIARQHWQNIIEHHEAVIPDVLNLLALPKNIIYKHLAKLVKDASRLKAFKAPDHNARFDWLMLQVVPAYADLLQHEPELARRFLSEITRIEAETR